MKLRAPTKIAFGTVAVMATAWFGYQSWARVQVDSVAFAPLAPARVNLVAVDPGVGYRITVANQVAQLEEVANAEFDAPDMAGGAADTVSRRRIPIRELLESLTGDEKALSFVVASVNEIKESNLPPIRVTWTAADLRRALEGDVALRDRLIRNLNVDFEGNPLPEVRPNALENGIVVQLPVPVSVDVEGVQKTLTATVQVPFLPTFAKAVTDRYAEKAEVSQEMILGFYRDEARNLRDGKTSRQDVRAALTALIDPERLKRLAIAPTKLFQATRIVANSDNITSAAYEGYQSSDGREFFDVRLTLTEEGRRRLWQYSRKHRGFQLLFAVDGIAIAAPRITTELPQSVVVIKQITDETLVQDAVAILNGKDASDVQAARTIQGD